MIESVPTANFFLRLPGDTWDKQARAGDVLVRDEEENHLFVHLLLLI